MLTGPVRCAMTPSPQQRNETAADQSVAMQHGKQGWASLKIWTSSIQQIGFTAPPKMHSTCFNMVLPSSYGSLGPEFNSAAAKCQYFLARRRWILEPPDLLMENWGLEGHQTQPKEPSLQGLFIAVLWVQEAKIRSLSKSSISAPETRAILTENIHGGHTTGIGPVQSVADDRKNCWSIPSISWGQKNLLHEGTFLWFCLPSRGWRRHRHRWSSRYLPLHTWASTKSSKCQDVSKRPGGKIDTPLQKPDTSAEADASNQTARRWYKISIYNLAKLHHSPLASSLCHPVKSVGLDWI